MCRSQASLRPSYALKYATYLALPSGPAACADAKAVFKKSALKYADQLIKWRFDDAKRRGFEYGYYHLVTEDKRECELEKREKLIFSACLKIKDNRQSYTDDACLVIVIRKQLQK